MARQRLPGTAEDADARLVTRRKFLRRGKDALLVCSAGSVAPFLLAGCGPAILKSSSVKVGLLHSQTGTMAISEISLRDAEMMAIEEINAAGGILGRPLEPIIEDGRSRFSDVFPKKAGKLLLEDKVAVVFGCWTSSSRKAVLPIFEKHNALLFYPLQYEGNESSRNIVYVGATPNQQIFPAIDWLLGSEGGSRKRIYLVGSDYVYPRTANYIIKAYLMSRAEQSAEIVGEQYTPLGHRDYKDVVSEIRTANPDVIINTINGYSNVAFFKELDAQGITSADIPVMSTSVGEDELRSILPSQILGHFSTWSYFQSLGSPRNKEFVSRFKKEYGPDRVTDDPIEAAYSQIHLWKLGVEKAGSFEADAVRGAFRSGIEFEAPGGKVKIDPRTQHAYKNCRIGRARDDGQFDIVFERKWIEPDPYPQIAFPGWQCDWTKDGLTKGAPVEIPS